MAPLLSIMDATELPGTIVKRSRRLPLESLKAFSETSSFKIDALGLVTLLGADEVNLAVGTLHSRRYTEHLPLLAAFVVAGGRFTSEQLGFVMYNLTDGIITTELKGWFTRWLMSHNVNNATTEFSWQRHGMGTHNRCFIPAVLSFSLIAPLLSCTILMGDWYGVGNVIAIILSVFIRRTLLVQLRTARDKKVEPPPTGKPARNQDDEPAAASGESNTRELDSSGEPHCDESNSARGQKKVEASVLCVIRPDGKMVTIRAPPSILETFIKDSRVTKQTTYTLLRHLGWLAFGVQVCILGMCTLFTQIYTVLLLVISTWFFTRNLRHDMNHEIVQESSGDFGVTRTEIHFNDEWIVTKTDHERLRKSVPGSEIATPRTWDRRLVAWARINIYEDDPTKRQVYGRLLSSWNLLPSETNEE